MSSCILIVDDEENLTYFLKAALEEKHYMVNTAGTLAEAQKILKSTFPDLILLDLNLPDGDGLDLFRMIKDKELGIPTIIITAHASVKSALNAVKLGVDDYIVKPFELDEIALNIEKQLENYRLHNQYKYYKNQLQEACGSSFFVSKLPQIEDIQNLAFKIAGIAESVILIEGPSGSGKEMLARFIHQNSPQAEAPFVEINCAALQENLLESELFGYEPGAFTDAKRRKIGLIELAEGGTLFLDEISEMRSALQARLLRVIETRTFKRLGGIRNIKVRLRIIAATNSDVQRLVSEKQLRKDLFYRLNMFHIKLPALAERLEEILLIAQFFLEKISTRLKRPIHKISQEARQLILDYDWPGNFRELHNTIERAVILCDGDTIEKRHLHGDLLKMHEINFHPSLRALQRTSLKGYLGEVEKSLVSQALQLTGNNQLRAAEILGEPRHIVRYLIKKHNLNG